MTSQLLNTKACSPILLFVRNGHRMRGKPPGIARTLKQRLESKSNSIFFINEIIGKNYFTKLYPVHDEIFYKGFVISIVNYLFQWKITRIQN